MGQPTRNKMIETLADAYGKKLEDYKEMTDEEIECEYERYMDDDDGGMNPNDDDPDE